MSQNTPFDIDDLDLDAQPVDGFGLADPNASFDIRLGDEDEEVNQDGAGNGGGLTSAVDHETPCSFLTGCAGSGKSWTIRDRQREDPMYAILCASTGISAVNLNATTIHSLLGFFDTNSLRDSYIKGAAQRKLKAIVGEGYKNVVLDEISMVSADTLDLIVRVFDDVNQNLANSEQPIGLVLTGDFAQLPPIADRKPGASPGARGSRLPVPWCFESVTWEKFEKNMTKLTKVWRQNDPQFMAALNYARAGMGQPAAETLAAAGVRFETSVDMEFDGTTLVGKNEEVDRFNQIALDRVQGRPMALPARRWGASRTEWKNIPDRTVLRENAYVMILSNKYEDGALIYANGDCGHVKGLQPSPIPGMPPSIVVELVRTGQEVAVSSIVRDVAQGDKPDGGVEVTLSRGEDTGGWLPKTHYRPTMKTYVVGQINYFPIRLAYATTVHKAQGLSLDRVQIDFRGWMMSAPAMSYVSLSRGRTLEGLRVVGQKEAVAKATKIDEKVRRWL